MRACRFSSVRSALAAGELLAQRRGVGVHRGARSELVDAHAERRRERARVVLGRRGGVGGGHDRHAHPLGAERIGGEAGDQRRVDPTGETEHDARKPFLLHVVAQAQAQRGVDLGLRGASGGQRAAAGHRRGAMWRVLALSRGSALLAAAPARRDRGRRSAASSSNCAARAIVAPVGSSTKECPSKTSSSWPPTSPQKAMWVPLLAGALGEQTLAFHALAGVVGGGGDVEDQPRARRGLLGRRGAGPPEVLADRQPDAPARRRRSPRPRVRPRSSAARRRRRSWGDAPCGRSSARRRRRAPPRRCARGGLRGAERTPRSPARSAPRFGLRTRRALLQSRTALGVPDHGDDPLHPGRQLLAARRRRRAGSARAAADPRAGSR